MSLNLAFGNALSGLSANARMAEITSSNLANALTEGYARRSVELSAISLDGRGAGVRIDGVGRQVDRGLMTERRDAETALSDRRASASALRGLEGDLGSSEAGVNLASRLQALEQALIAASADPSSETRLGQVLDRLEGVASTLRDGSAAVQRRRAEADASIAAQVTELNASLQGIARLNTDIVTAQATGRDATALMDRRHVLLDKVATMVPIREMDRPGGSLILITPQGATLLDGTRAATIGFEVTPAVMPAMTLASGALSGLTLEGRTLDVDGVGALAGGALGAAFILRDQILPAAGTHLDALARDLLERFADPGTDPTVESGASLFSDNGTPLNPADTTGLAGRIQVHASVDPTRGGAFWRLRDGVGAVTPGPLGDASQIGRWLSALDVPRTLTTGGRPGSAANLAAMMVADLGAQRLSAEREESFANARWTSFRQAELSNGVDTDQEMQGLLQIEKAYAANARVISTVDAMMQAVLEI